MDKNMCHAMHLHYQESIMCFMRFGMQDGEQSRHSVSSPSDGLSLLMARQAAPECCKRNSFQESC